MSNSTVSAVMASAARLSADVLPGISTCPGTQENVMSMCVLLCVVRSWLRRFERDVDCPDCILCNELNESVSMTIGLSRHEATLHEAVIVIVWRAAESDISKV